MKSNYHLYSIILCYVLLFLSASCTRYKETTSILFQSGNEGYDTFRIPAIIKVENGNAYGRIIAFAEGRKKTSGDTGDIDLVMKFSDDGGQSWSKLGVIWDDSTNTCGNPAPIQDPATKKIIMMMTWNNGHDPQYKIENQTSIDTRRIFYTESSDLGNTWTKPVELTDILKPAGTTWYGTGPCHAIVKNHEPHKGRIVVPVYCKDTLYDGYATILYSDDNGVTWKCGNWNREGGASESTVAELENGDLILNFRNESRPGESQYRSQYRPFIISHDGGQTWTDKTFCEELTEPCCQGSILSSSYSGRLYFLNPHSKKERKYLTLQSSIDNSRSWSVIDTIYKESSAYSDMVELDKHNLGLLYETDNYNKIIFQIYNVKRTSR